MLLWCNGNIDVSWAIGKFFFVFLILFIPNKVFRPTIDNNNDYPNLGPLQAMTGTVTSNDEEHNNNKGDGNNKNSHNKGDNEDNRDRRMKAQDNKAGTGATRGQGCDRTTNEATSMGRGMGGTSAGDQEHNTGPPRCRQHL
jgi:hypothetical protein